MKPLKEKHKQYTTDFKLTAIRLAQHPNVQTQDVAAALGIHPFMLSRWKKEHKEGEFKGPVHDSIKGIEETVLEQRNVRDFDWSKTPELEYTDNSKDNKSYSRVSTKSSQLRGAWYIARIVLGLIAGFIVFLFIHGSIVETAPATSKVLLISLFAGLSAPSMLKEIQDKYTKRLSSEISEGLK